MPQDTPPSPPRALLSMDEAAHALGISSKHLRNLTKRGKVATVRLGRRVLIPRKELERIVEEGVQP